MPISSSSTKRAEGLTASAESGGKGRLFTQRNAIIRFWPVALLVLTAVACTQRTDSTIVPTSTVSASRGEQLYVANCQVCHGGATGGSMMDIPPPHNANGHTWHHSDRQLTDIVLNGSGEMGEMMRRMMGASADTPRMPAWRGTLTEEDVAAILAYIKTWWTEEQRQWQVRVSEVSR